MNQTTIFDLIYKKYKIKKPIRLIELFSDYGSQALALKYLGINFEHWKICEWSIKSIQAYKDIHFTNQNYDSNLPKSDIIDYLFRKGISSNYNDPMSYSQIKRLSEKKLKLIYENIKITHNLVNIQQVKGKDLEIKDTDKYDYILTYSFPCQDLSLAGKGRGMSDTSTRSGMIWEVERILDGCNEIGSLPQILLMENVPQVHSNDNIDDFNKWQLKLEKLGYKNYCKDLIATDYGIPQTRNRCFMISILGKYNYTFPKPIPLKIKLSDLLEHDVDKKYFVKEGTLKCFMKELSGKFPRRKRFLDSLYMANVYDIDGTLTALMGGKATDNHIIVPENTKKGYTEAYPGDGVYIKNIKGKRGMVQHQMIQTLKTSPDVGVVMKDFKIRNLTPKECFRLMGVKDEDFEKVRKNQSDNSLYHLAGDSIVVNVLMAIFKEFI